MRRIIRLTHLFSEEVIFISMKSSMKSSQYDVVSNGRLNRINYIQTIKHAFVVLRSVHINILDSKSKTKSLQNASLKLPRQASHTSVGHEDTRKGHEVNKVNRGSHYSGYQSHGPFNDFHKLRFGDVNQMFP